MRSLKFVAAAMLWALMAVQVLADDNLRYVNAAKLTVINKAQDDDKVFQRLDVDKYPDLSETVRRYYRYSTGLAVMFRTNSTNISAKWTTVNKSAYVNNTLLTQRGLDLYILRDGEWIFAGYGKPSAEGTEHSSSLVSSLEPGMYDCMLYLPAFDEVTSLSIGVDKKAIIQPGKNPFKHKIVVIGSSITHGSGASRPSQVFPAQLERIMGFEFVNLGANGQCKLDEFFAHVAADTEADAFLFDAFSNPSAEMIDERLEQFVRIIRRTHPDTPLIFIQTLVRESGNFNTATRDFEAAKRAAAEAGMKSIMNKFDKVYFINPGMDVGDDHEGTVEGIHPSDLGYYRMLQSLVPRLKKILRKNGID